MKYTRFCVKECTNNGTWWVVDADGLVLGRMASQIASRIRGKHNPFFSPHMDTGDPVVVINANKVLLTGDKMNQKMYYRHSGYIGGLKSIKAKDLLIKNPQRLIRNAVKGMLPKNKLGMKLIKKLKIYSGNKHPHRSQKIQKLEII